MKIRHKKYWQTRNGMIISRLSSYIKIDKSKGQICDLTPEDVGIFMDTSCIYCGHTDGRGGADRIDNKKGHTKDNVVPACGLCNITRMNNYTYEEMKMIGEVIKKIRHERSLIANVDNP